MVNFKAGQYYSKEKYEKLLEFVNDALKENKDASLEEIRAYIFKKSGIMDDLLHFYNVKKYAPGAVINISTPFHSEKLVFGNQQEVIYQNNEFIPSQIKMTKDSIFDLASVTKLFAAISTLQLISDGRLKMDDRLEELAPQFVKLKDLTVADLLRFVMIKTPVRVDGASNINEAEARLFDAEYVPLEEEKDRYNDFAPMVLKYVIENVSGITYEDFIKKNILDPLNMKDTHVKIPESKITRLSNSLYDGRFYVDGNFLIRTDSPLGYSTDSKAVSLGQPEGKLSGHAGLFSTSQDMENLGWGLINKQILNEEMIDSLGTRQVGQIYNDETGAIKATQFFSYLAYVTNPLNARTEVFQGLGNKSFAGAGWTGTQFIVDPENKIVCSLLSNRTHNRMTHIDNIHRENIIKLEDGTEVITLPNGRQMIDASKYAHLRSEFVTDKCSELAIMYRILEDIVGLDKDLSLSSKQR